MRRSISFSVNQIQGAGPNGRPTSVHSPGVSLEYLRHRAGTLLQAGVAPNSKLTYDTSVRAFEKFRGSYHLPQLWPIPSQQIILFITFCYEKGQSPKTISTYVAGLSYFHKLYGFYDLHDIFVIKKLVEGCRRSRVSRDSRAPLTKQALQAIYDVLPMCCFNEYEASLFRAAFTLAYFGLFRVSELVVPAVGLMQRVISLQDVAVVENSHVSITLYYFKTNQNGNPVVLKIPKDKSTLCPVKALAIFLSKRPSVAGPLFIHSNGIPITRAQFSAVLSKCVHAARLSASKCFKTHSFRIGRATDLAAQGVSSSAIMKLGRWSSNCFKTYIR